ncbi:MAG: hypothetical protein NWR49_06490 [Crocinitomicaceae bacterium]|nr:hypothetical protein [Crocinitomicaceae bacterium]MDP4806744.1 hypothetical protein [Crocinitomicaceae bacterium]
MRILVLSVSLLLSNLLLAQDTLRALFIGNSYMGVNNLPQLVQALSSSLGDVLIYDSNTPGGQTFQMQAANPVNYQKMAAQEWDYIILQGQSQEPSFPFEQVNSQTLPYAVQLADSAKAIQPCSQVNYFMTWGRQNGDPQWDSISTFDKMNARLRDAYLRISDSANAAVSPVGVAWKYIRDNHPSINLYQQDGSHPSLEGSYLAACVFYSSLFHQSSFGSNYNPGIDLNTASILQTVASSIVLDSLNTWQLVHPDSTLQASVAYSSIPGASILSFTATANQDANFTWYFPDMTIETGAIIGFEYNLSTYQVMLIAEGLCDTDTVLIDVNNSSAGLSNASQIQWKVTGPQQMELYGTLIGEIEAFDVVGKTQHIMREDLSNGSRITFPVNTSFLRVQTPNEATTIRIPYLLN